MSMPVFAPHPDPSSAAPTAKVVQCERGALSTIPASIYAESVAAAIGLSYREQSKGGE